MPGTTQQSSFRTIIVRELHPTFGAEIDGVDFPNPDEEQFNEIKAALAKYGFCVFRKTGLSDQEHVDFSRRLGELDDIRPYMTNGRKPRYGLYELFDASNLDDNGEILAPDSQRAQYNKGNTLFHVDSSFNPRRASYSLLRAVQLPPPGTGGDTEFADSRTAFDALPAALKGRLLAADYVVAHSLAHSRKTASPAYFAGLNPAASPMYRHKLVQFHEPSGRMNLYTAAHAHHVEGLPADESRDLLDALMRHVARQRFVVSVPWLHDGDMIAWDNTCVLHRATGGEFVGRFKRDCRRTTVHDASSTAWGLNGEHAKRAGFKYV